MGSVFALILVGWLWGLNNNLKRKNNYAILINEGAQSNAV
jgi:hypothetical protein